MMIVDGRKYTEEEIKSIVRNFSSRKKTPKVEEPFEVDPTKIDRHLFENPRKDQKQEKARKLIIEAFDQLDRHPEYKKTFYTLMPEKTWESETVARLLVIAKARGKMATWIHLALEWAQRIQNGASWEELCNNPDSANWFRIVRWKTNYRSVGGSQLYGGSPADVDKEVLKPRILVEDSIPLIIIWS